MTPIEHLQQRAKLLPLHGLLAHWHELTDTGWVETLLDWEERERARRSLVRRLTEAHIGRCKPLADFDWSWPEQCDQAAISELMTLEFLNTAANAILSDPAAWVKPGWLKISTIRPYCKAIPSCSLLPGKCSANWPLSIATRPCVAA